MTAKKQDEILEIYYTLAREYLENGQRHKAWRVIQLANQMHPAFIKKNNSIMHFGGEEPKKKVLATKQKQVNVVEAKTQSPDNVDATKTTRRGRKKKTDD